MTESGATCQPPEGCGYARPLADVGGWLREGWIVTMDHIWPLLALAVLWVWLFAVLSVLNWHALTLLLLGPATGAAYAVAFSAVRTGRPDFNRLALTGPVLLQLVLAGILLTIFVAFGLALVILPGVLIAALYLFTLLHIVDRGMPFWEAMEESRKMVQRDWVGFAGFAAALIGINLLGLAAMGIGVLLTIPVTWCAVAVAYEQLWPGEAKG